MNLASPVEATVPAGLAASQGEAIVRLIETAQQVKRRYQFFVWLQSHVRPLLPHQVAVCGAYQRQEKNVVLEPFHTVPMPDDAMRALLGFEGPVVRAAVQAWLAQRCRPITFCLSVALGDAVRVASGPLIDQGLDHWLVHGVSRPQRPHELELLFLLSTPHARVDASQLKHMELLMPHLASTYLRMQATEHELGIPAPQAPLHEGGTKALVTRREIQILAWVREGMSNHQISAELGISPLTVKNHVQKILRKLGAANRAQAVAKAMSLGLLDLPGGTP
jgi:transcriptional regulator EpsA